MTDHSKFRLGKLSAVPTPHLPAMEKYAAIAPLPEPPDDINWNDNIPWTPLGNLYVGDCTCAGMLHYIQAAQRWRDGTAMIPTDAQALYAYSRVSDYPNSDTGALISDVLTKWQTEGFSAPGGIDTIRAIMRIDPANILHMRQALWLFGPLIIGVRLPIAAQTQTRWVTPANLIGNNAPNTWGGHCVLLVGWHSDGTIDIITWGQAKTIEAGWLAAYCDESWAVLHPAWAASGKSPSGFPIDQLTADMRNGI
jgi:hypothetical protein